MLLIGINPSHNELIGYFGVFDKNKDGKITQDEFIGIFRNAVVSELMHSNHFVSEIKKVFKFIDKEHKHYLNYNEVMSLFKHLGMHMK